MAYFSIITINLNNKEGLEKTVKSVLSQKFNDYEYIIIDGLSTDGSVDIIDKYAMSLKYSISEKDKGVYNAMNKGLYKATGKYVIFLNSGDCFVDENVLNNVAKHNYDTDFIIGDLIFVYNNKTEIGERVPQKLTLYHFYRSTIWHQSTFTKRESLLKYDGYDESLKISSDWKFIMLGICKYNMTYKIIETPISYMDTFGMSGAAGANDLIYKEHLKVWNEHFPYTYADYEELHQWKKLTIKRIKNTLSYYIFLNLRRIGLR